MNSETKTSYAGDETRSTGSMGKLDILDLIAKFMPSLKGTSLPGSRFNQYSGPSPTTGMLVISRF